MPDRAASARCAPSQASRSRGGRQRTTPRRSDVAVERAAQHQGVRAAELLGDVGRDPLVGGRGGGEHRDAVGQVGEQGADAAVVGPEVVAPVGDAVRLVDDQQPGGARRGRQHLVAEVGVVEPLGRHQHDVDLARVGCGRRRRAHSSTLAELTVTARMPGPLGRGDLVAHQRQQRRHDDGRARAPRPQQRGRDEVDGRLAPAGALHDQRPAVAGHQRLDRRPLVVAQGGVAAAHQRPQRRLRPRPADPSRPPP